MALGGGTFLTENKELPGSYINFISASKASAVLSDRGIVAIPLILDWGVDGEIFTVDSEMLQKDSMKVFGYEYTNQKLAGLRDLFRNAKVAHLFKLNKGVAASNEFAMARCTGIRGNDLKVIVQKNVDHPMKFDVITMLGTVVVDTQTVETAEELKENNFAAFKKDVTLAVTIGMPLTGGTNGSEVTGADHQAFLDKIESYSFNVLGCLSKTAEVIALYMAYTKRMREEVGAKFQTVVYKTGGDHEGIINLENKILNPTEDFPEYSLIYWLSGAEAGCPINKDNTNKKYDGEFEVDVNYKQSALTTALKEGKLIFHKVGSEVRILDDINSHISFTEEKSSDFASNQTVRILDQIGNDIAVLFNTKYLGNTLNDRAGRISFWNDLVTYYKELEKIRAIEDFQSEDVVVEEGATKKSVSTSCPVTLVNAMKQLYMTVVVK